MLYNVICKPSLRPYQAGLRRKLPELEDDYFNRCREWFNKAGEDDPKLLRIPLYVDPEQQRLLEEELWELTQQLLFARKRKFWYQNTANCFTFNRPCSYLPICASKNNPLVVENQFRQQERHPELNDVGKAERLPRRFDPIPYRERIFHGTSTNRSIETQNAPGRIRNPAVRTTESGQNDLCQPVSRCRVSGDGSRTKRAVRDAHGYRFLDKFNDVCLELHKGNHGFKTVVIDTIDNLWQLCRQHYIKKYGVEHETDGKLGYGKGSAIILAEFQRVMTKLSLLDMGLLMISHAIVKRWKSNRHRR